MLNSFIRRRVALALLVFTLTAATPAIAAEGPFPDLRGIWTWLVGFWSSDEERGLGLDPNGLTSDRGLGLDPDGLTTERGAGIDPNGLTGSDRGLGLDPDGLTSGERGLGLDPNG